MGALGLHLLLELTGCSANLLNNAEFIEKSLLEAAKKAGATVVDYSFNRFNPYGISGFVVIAESHISIHTWPEFSYAAIDVFTCGDKSMPYKAATYLIEMFGPCESRIDTLKRGLFKDEKTNQRDAGPNLPYLTDNPTILSKNEYLADSESKEVNLHITTGKNNENIIGKMAS